MKTLEQQYKEETGLNAYEPNNMRPNIPEDIYVEWLEDKIEQLPIHNVSHRLLRELRQTYLVNVDNDGQPKASITEILDLWDRVNQELKIVTID